MGDRGNIVVMEEGGGKIYLYTHWDGYKLPKILKEALKRGAARWHDESYLTRIIFCEMIKDDVVGDQGYGIATYQQDQNHPNLEVYVGNQKVVYGNEEWSFQAFIDES